MNNWQFAPIENNLAVSNILGNSRMNSFPNFRLVSWKTVTQFVRVTHVRQAWAAQTPSLIEIDSRPFPDYTNTSALIAAIYWCVMVIALHLATKGSQSLHSSIFSETPKVTLISLLIHIHAYCVNLAHIHLCHLSEIAPFCVEVCHVHILCPYLFLFLLTCTWSRWVSLFFYSHVLPFVFNCCSDSYASTKTVFVVLEEQHWLKYST